MKYSSTRNGASRRVTFLVTRRRVCWSSFGRLVACSGVVTWAPCLLRISDGCSKPESVDMLGGDGRENNVSAGRPGPNAPDYRVRQARQDREVQPLDLEYPRQPAQQRCVEGNEHPPGGQLTPATCAARPDARTDSTHQTHSSRWPCSPAEGPAPNYPAEPHEFTHGNVRRPSIATIQTQQHPQTRTKSKIQDSLTERHCH